jgi:hypothetical protein
MTDDGKNTIRRLHNISDVIRAIAAASRLLDEQLERIEAGQGRSLHPMSGTTPLAFLAPSQRENEEPKSQRAKEPKSQETYKARPSQDRACDRREGAGSRAARERNLNFALATSDRFFWGTLR